MTLITSISGIRGTIGGKEGQGLTPVDVLKFTSAFSQWVKNDTGKETPLLILGRDARMSGEMVNHLVCGTLLSCGVDVIDIGLTTTPTAEMAVGFHNADGGIILTASHNPKQWNALKLLNSRGEFLSAADGENILELAARKDRKYAEVQDLGICSSDDSCIQKHIETILELPLVDVEAIKKAKFTVAVDAVNSTGGIAVPMLLTALGVNKVVPLYCDPNGDFPHNPEPLPENITDICEIVVKNKAHVGFVVDPDVDRLAIVNQLGEPFGEEYTLVAVADYVLGYEKGNTVSNLSSTQALQGVTQKHGGKYFASAVGEVNVVECMKEHKAVIGGEGNGGVIYPALHYGRDALVGIALFLSYLARSGKNCSKLRDEYPSYFISKNKITFTQDMDIDDILKKIAKQYRNRPVSTIDGIKIHFDGEWVHLRKSNTEAIVRIYAESNVQAKADHLAMKLMRDVDEIIRGNE
ncbi:MAG: phosphoglucosamine mutase [Bacteroidetes bacterium]|nr:phosphoglucosamine mutase [Bacteroidota bacterium]